MKAINSIPYFINDSELKVDGQSIIWSDRLCIEMNFHIFLSTLTLKAQIAKFAQGAVKTEKKTCNIPYEELQ